MAPSPIPAEETVLPIPCKVNLRLAVGARRPGGYHDIDTFFLPLPEPSDTMRLRRYDEPGDIDFTCSDPELETDDNLVVRAYRAYAAATGYSPRLDVCLTKHIPHGAGLGGGSSDAAALLRYVNDRAGAAALAASDLASLALTLGADIPFFLLGSPAMATGVGETLLPSDPGLAGWCAVVVCPTARVKTAWAYAALDAARAFPEKAGHSRLTSVFDTNKRAFCVTGAPMRNDFESVVFAAHPELGRVKERLLALGAAGALLSGTGSAVFGLFRQRQTASLALAVLSGSGPRVYLAPL
ncbi:4-(cytidine 5'-diphospho)-2-C-methyl-D-erythritol kinase [Desulfovibrio aerotolerans]|uniref:4-diphosphocytidyl-2-C-methyl-D-erythritol kinase n=1 Tax=Solidesulfovibrio aerotolerans TaxID=295255 RepID=A0A7C9MLL9_9BACT|nr:4-(cytidine 5'-diphospho)-2-C-methyl-D-erythritol kinase [Solidesulfovibrio aerotolerans]MYL85249.1 4-(cytidine 5'-diphospho)-2-C-methyl-D-erythritol kinase [Solidesulfovibrio aerotolerans]